MSYAGESRQPPRVAGQHQGIAPSDALQSGATDAQSRGTRELERRVLDALHLVPVGFLGQLGQPESLAVLDRHLGSRSAHAGAGLEFFQHLMRQPAIAFEQLHRFDEGFELPGAVESSLRRRRLDRASEAQVACSVIGSVEQILHLRDVRLRSPQLGLDDATAPGIRARVSDGARKALELGELLCLVCQRQMEGLG